MRVDDPGDRDPAARELLDDHAVGRQIESHPAVLLGNRHPEEPELLHLVDDRLRELVLVVVMLGVGQDLLVGELPDHRDDVLLLVGVLAVRGGYGHDVTVSRIRKSSGVLALSAAYPWPGGRGKPERLPRQWPTSPSTSSSIPPPTAWRSSNCHATGAGASGRSATWPTARAGSPPTCTLTTACAAAMSSSRSSEISPGGSQR